MPVSTVKTRIRVLYADTDQMGVVYYANFLRYFEAGRTEYLRAQGFSYAEAERRHDMRLPVIEVTARYKQPARYDDEIDVETVLAFTGRSSVRFDYRILRGMDLLAEGHTIHACIDGEGKVRKLPDEFLEQVKTKDDGPV